MRRAAAVLALALAACSASPAPEPAALASDPAAVHDRILTLDSHLDTPVHFNRPGWNFAERHSFATDLSHVDIPRMRQGGLDGGFFVVYTPQGPLTPAGFTAAAAHAERRLAGIERVLRDHGDALALATRADDAARIAATGKRFVYLAVENSYALGDSVAGLAGWHARGVRIAGPVHNRGNQFADSAGGPVRWNGLSPLGRQWVAEMNRLGMVIDASHASDAALEQMIALSATPVILSHSGPKAAYDHPRNIDDRLLRLLAAKGGVMQINSVFLARYNVTPARSALMTRMAGWDDLSPAQQRMIADDWAALDRSEILQDADFAMFMASLLHCLRIAGVDHCGIGADWDGGGGVRGMEDVAALPRITAALLAAGYAEADVEKIWSGNALRLLRAAGEYAARPAGR